MLVLPRRNSLVISGGVLAGKVMMTSNVASMKDMPLPLVHDTMPV
jgi:hypothetical protein